MIRREHRIDVRSEPCGDVDIGLGVVNDPDESVPFLGGDLDQAVFAAVDLTEGVVAGDRPQRAVRIVGPAVIAAREDAATALRGPRASRRGVGTD